MKALWCGALLGLLLVLSQAPLPLTAVATVLSIAGHPTVLAFAVGVLTRPWLARRMRGWTA